MKPYYRYFLSLAVSCCLIAPATTARPLATLPDDAIIEQLPKTITLVMDKNSQLRQQLQQQPNNLNTAVALAKNYIEIAQSQADPRFLGYAQGALSPWWTLKNPPIEARLLRAILYQNQHQFIEAMKDLNEVIKVAPNNQQAWLLKATLHQSMGEYQEAIGSCYQLAKSASAVISSTCMAGSLFAANLPTHAMKSLQALSTEAIHQETAMTRQWLYTLQAEISAHLKQPEAHSLFIKSLNINKRNPYLLLVYTDYLLQQNQGDKVIKLLGKDKSLDETLLVQLARAYRMIGNTKETEKYQQRLNRRFKLLALQNKPLHKAAAARYALEFESNPRKALRLAEDNWQQQKTYRDKQLLEDAMSAINISKQPLI